MNAEKSEPLPSPPAVEGERMKQEIFWRPGFHRCNPNPREDYGISGVRMVWVLSDEHHAISWELSTDWGMPKEDFDAACPGCTHWAHRDGYPSMGGPRPACVAFHFDQPTPVDGDGCDGCLYLGGRRCYGDIGFIMADEGYRLLTVEGDEAVWEWMASTLDEYESDMQERENVDA